MAPLSVRINSIVRRCIHLLPATIRLRALTRLDVWQGFAEAENVHMPRLVPKDRRSVALDVGANNGVTTQIMSCEFALIHAFEPHPQMAAELKACAPKNVEVHPIALSSKDGPAELVIPISKDVAMSGWGSLGSAPLCDFERLEKKTIATCALDSFHFEAVDYIKIDVEGHELEVLEGAKETLRRCRPWLVIEALGEQQEKVRSFLIALDYQQTDLPTVAGVIGTVHNLIFLPC